jgi:hypothetical protein
MWSPEDVDAFVFIAFEKQVRWQVVLEILRELGRVNNADEKEGDRFGETDGIEQQREMGG